MRELVRQSISRALDALRAAGWMLPPEVPVTLDRPRRPEHGDVATSVALGLAKPTGKRPREIAEALATALRDEIATGEGPLDSIEIAGPGFLNLRVRDGAYHRVIERVLSEGKGYGVKAPSGDGRRVLVEFVSANPTGPLHVGHGRGAVVGDVLVRLLRAAGETVTTEYYINDAGAQVRLLAASVRAVAGGGVAPEGGYGGEYVRELAAELTRDTAGALEDMDDEALAGASVDRMMAGIRATLGRLDIGFDGYFSERSLTDSGSVARVMEKLRDGGYLQDRDGALFFKTGGAGDTEDEKDRVVRKRNGDWTYFATDLAYHQAKLVRGYSLLIDLWGADHHGYVARMRAGLEALGLPAGAFEVLLTQMVRLIREGREFKMSKRAGNFVTVDEVLDEIDEAAQHPGAGRDAVRYFFLSRSADAPVDFDLDLAKRQTVDNPVFYAQMAHARMCSILDRARHSEEMAPARAAGALSLPAGWDAKLAEKLTLPEERDILALCDGYPELVMEAATARAPHRVVFFVQELAQAFASYFTRMQRVHGEPVLPQKGWRDAHPDWVGDWDWEKTRARLMWLLAVRQVYASALGLLGIEAPERMVRTSEVVEA